MIRHPVYMALCAAAVVYLSSADSRGWSFFRTAAMRMAAGSGGGRGSFNHK